MEAVASVGWDANLEGRIDAIKESTLAKPHLSDTWSWSKRVEVVQAIAEDLLGPKYLPKNLFYHDLVHTREVYYAARTYGFMENLGDREHELLMVAALMHDTGYLIKYDANEPDGAKIARKVMTRLGWYTEDEIKLVEQIIMATQMPQKPNTLLERIICDADLSNLGHDDYPQRSAALRTEWEARGTRYTDKEWLELQQKFLSNHKFFTASGENGLAGQQQKRNLDGVKKSLAALEAQARQPK